MNPTAPAVTPFGLLMGMALIGIAMLIMAWVRLPLKKDLLVGGIRTTIQLLLLGYVLEFVFQANHWGWVGLLIAVMLGVATHTAQERIRWKPPAVIWDIGLALLLGCGVTMAWVMLAVVKVEHWYDPQYLVPLAGMMIGNAMNGAALALDRYEGELVQRKDEVETLLALGASGKQAAETSMQAAIKAAMIPQINMLMTVGIVTIPGITTGQILAGQSPLAAVTYQIIIMFMLASTVSIATVVLLKLAVKKSFNAAEQMIVRLN